MKVLWIDWRGDDGVLDIALRMLADGHEVRWHLAKNKQNVLFGKGLVQRVHDWRPWMNWADLVIMSDNTYRREIDAWRKKSGMMVVGPTSETASWEHDRPLGQRIFKRAGIPILPFKEFRDYDSAIAYVKRENRRFVSKPIGDEENKALSYVAKSPADLVYMLSRWKREGRKPKGGFMLQEHVSGCEMAVGAFFGPHGFSEGYCENWEFKSMFAGDMGPNCGEKGTVVRFVKKSKLADKVLRPLEDELLRQKYVGYVDVNTIIDEDGDPWPLEFTTRFGWPTFNIQQALVKGDSAEWLYGLAEGKDLKPFEMNSVAVGVVMALMEKIPGVPVYGITPSIRGRLHPIEMMMGNAPQEKDGKIQDGPLMVTAGDYILVATGTADTVTGARRRAYGALSKLSTPGGPFWRPDIGVRLKKQIPEVQAFGYATGMTY